MFVALLLMTSGGGIWSIFAQCKSAALKARFRMTRAISFFLFIIFSYALKFKLHKEKAKISLKMAQKKRPRLDRLKDEPKGIIANILTAFSLLREPPCPK